MRMGEGDPKRPRFTIGLGKEVGGVKERWCGKGGEQGTGVGQSLPPLFKHDVKKKRKTKGFGLKKKWGHKAWRRGGWR